MFFKKQCVSISNDMKTSAIPIFWFSRTFGIAPISVNHFENTVIVKLTISQIVYSYTVGLLSVYLATTGIIEEVIYMDINESTTKYVTVMMMIIVLLTIIIGIFGAPFRFSNFSKFTRLIYEIDILIPPQNLSRGRNSSIRSIILTLLTAIISFTMRSYVMYAYSEGSWYVTIRETLFYCIVMMLECQYWYMTSMVQRRIHLLNDILSTDNCHINKKWQHLVFSNETVLDTQNQLVKQPFINSDFGFHPTTNNKTWKKVVAITHKFPSIEYGWKLVKVYVNLCSVVENLNGCCGLFISVIIVIDLLQLTITGYFLIVELQSNFDIYYTTLLSLMFLVYFYRLVFITEPCEDTLKQVNRTNVLVCKLLCLDLTDWYKIQMTVLYEQLLQRRIEFSAYGLSNIDRSLITTILANVTVYLVAVLQFKISED